MWANQPAVRSTLPLPHDCPGISGSSACGEHAHLLGRTPPLLLIRITRDKGALAKDDRLDALAMAVAYWAKAMTVETSKVVQQNRDKAMQQEIERYLQHAIGRKPTGSLYAPTMHRR